MSIPAAKLFGSLRSSSATISLTMGLRIGVASRAARGSAHAPTIVASK